VTSVPARSIKARPISTTLLRRGLTAAFGRHAGPGVTRRSDCHAARPHEIDMSKSIRPAVGRRGRPPLTQKPDLSALLATGSILDATDVGATIGATSFGTATPRSVAPSATNLRRSDADRGDFGDSLRPLQTPATFVHPLHGMTAGSRTAGGCVHPTQQTGDSLHPVHSGQARYSGQARHAVHQQAPRP
jgi:hypothetical protein